VTSVEDAVYAEVNGNGRYVRGTILALEERTVVERLALGLKSGLV
jgi:hypothetical protein